MISRALWTAKHKGISHLLKRAAVRILPYIRELYREYSDYLLCIIMGPERAFRVRVAIFKFMCEHNLFGNSQKALWLGRRIRHRALKPTYIDPCEVKYTIKRGWGYPPYIQDGDWDLNKKERQLNDAVVQLFIDNIPAEETDQYKMMKEAIENKDWHMSRDCRTQEDLDAYFETLKDIYRDMSRGKYRTKSEVKARYQDRRRRYYPDEILVSIGRNGEYIGERGGGHRLSIAQLVKIKKVPVIIIGKHYLYVKSKKDWISCHM